MLRLLVANTPGENILVIQQIQPPPPPPPEPTPSPTPIIELPLPGGQQDAEIDIELNVPSCSTASSSCSTGGLVAGRGKLGPEQNFPNSLDGCTDSDAGNYNIS